MQHPNNSIGGLQNDWFCTIFYYDLVIASIDNGFHICGPFKPKLTRKCLRAVGRSRMSKSKLREKRKQEMNKLNDLAGFHL
jgi:hypothetical protein